MIDDPAFYAVAVPAILLFGLSKSGLGAALGIASVPIMSLAVSPLRAAAIMLPIIIVMDVFAVWSYRRDADLKTLKIVVPTAFAGIAIGWALAARITDDHVRAILGVIAVAFAARHFLMGGADAPPRPHNPPKGWFWGMVSGFTSFVSHSGGIPLQMYTLPLKLDPAALAGTTAFFFAIVNAAKLVPYIALGQLSLAEVKTAAILSPLAQVSILAGVWLVRRIPKKPFYTLTYAGVMLVGLKLLYDAVLG